MAQLDKDEQIGTTYRAARAAEDFLKSICMAYYGIPPCPSVELASDLMIEWQTETATTTIEIDREGCISWWIYRFGGNPPSLERDMTEGEFAWSEGGSPEKTTAMKAILDALWGKPA
jgi:hypothetical protein